MSEFSGFPKECVQFYKNLMMNNSKEWFQAHKSDFDEHVMTPAKAFVVAMGERLREISPEVYAEPAVNRSIFRIYRDVRFSPDKTPYKTHLGLWFWEGDGKKMESSGYYFHLEPPNLMLGVGVYQFPKVLLEEYRASLVHPKHGKVLRRAIDEALKKGKYDVGGQHYKRLPRGYDADHENADLLRHNGFWLGTEREIPQEFYSVDLLDYCLGKFSDLLPVHNWLVKMIKRASI